MSRLRDALYDYVGEIVGGSPAITQEMRARLTAIQHRNAIYLRFAAAMLLALFLVMSGVVVLTAIGKAHVAVLSLCGISVVGIARVMLALWREKLATEMLIELSELDDDILRKVVARLLRCLR